MIKKILLSLVVFIIPSLTIMAVAKNKNILILGDSLSAAHGMNEEEGWVALLAKEISKSYPEVYLVNRSISGNTSENGLQRLPPLLKEFSPSIVVVELGGNDGLRALSLKNLESNLTKIIELSRASQAKVLLLGIEIPPNYGARYTQSFAQVFPRIAKQTKVEGYVPFFISDVALDKRFMQDDGIHPNGQAQPKIMMKVKPALMKLLR